MSVKLWAVMAALASLSACAQREGVAELVVHDDPRFVEPVIQQGSAANAFYVYDAEPLYIPPGGTQPLNQPLYVFDAEPLWVPPAPVPQVAATPRDVYREQMLILRK